MSEYEDLDAIVRAVAALLPFPVDLIADMGGPSMLQIDLGTRGAAEDPPDTAAIDPTVEPTVWTFDVEGGRETIASSLGVDAAPEEVAAWIEARAREWKSPSTQA